MVRVLLAALATVVAGQVGVVDTSPSGQPFAFPAAIVVSPAELAAAGGIVTVTLLPEDGTTMHVGSARLERRLPGERDFSTFPTAWTNFASVDLRRRVNILLTGPGAKNVTQTYHSTTRKYLHAESSATSFLNRAYLPPQPVGTAVRLVVFRSQDLGPLYSNEVVVARHATPLRFDNPEQFGSHCRDVPTSRRSLALRIWTGRVWARLAPSANRICDALEPGLYQVVRSSGKVVQYFLNS